MLPLFDLNPTRRPPVIVVTFILANIVLLAFDVLVLRRPPGELTAFSWTWSLVPERLWTAHGGRVWVTAVTHMFLHAGWLHLIGNCWFLWLFGNNIEDRLGHVRFVAFYLVCGLGAAVAQVAVSPHSTLPMLGASGAISGVLGAYMRLFPRAPVFTLVPFLIPVLPIPAFVFAGVWFVIQFLQGAGTLLSSSGHPTGGVAWWAHVGGFLTGYGLAGLARSQRPRARRA